MDEAAARMVAVAIQKKMSGLRAGTVEPAHFVHTDPHPARRTASPSQPALRLSASTSACPLLVF